MKISLGTVEMTDEQRSLLANVLDGKENRRKANRVEAKAFVWRYGETWEETLADMASGASSPEPAEDDDEDLLGDDESSDELEDLL